jgi:PAS domain S-box-containing protein
LKPLPPPVELSATQAFIAAAPETQLAMLELDLRLRALVDGANDAVVTINVDSIIVDWNRAAERMFGWTRQQAIGQTLTDLIVPHEHRHAHHHGLARYLGSGHSRMLNTVVETSALHRDGHRLDVELSVWPVKGGSSQRAWTFSSFIRDVTARKAAERALAESEAKYRSVVENADEGIVVARGGRIVYANPRCVQLAGRSLDELHARPFSEFVHPDDRARVLANHMRRQRGEPAEDRYSFRIILPNEDVRWIELSGVPIEWNGERAALNFLTDVTLRRKAEDDIRAALERAQELAQMKSRFVAVTSHEFRTPLAAIYSSAELLHDYGARMSEDERRELLGDIKQAVRRLNGMIEQLLLMSRLESGAQPFEPEPLRLEDLLGDLLDEIARGQPLARPRMRVDLPPELAGQWRSIDPRLLRPALLNLLTNALKYSPAEAPVQLRLAQGQGDPSELEMEVIDEGIGIPEADQARLFESFVRASNVGNIQGTGIGLTIVKDCAERHGGRIELDSAPGRGSRFTLTIRAPICPGIDA